MEKLNPSDLFSFGVFEVDLRVGELRKQGMKIRLQEQPFQILTLLLERQGALITREELRQTLWSDDTFVDFDHSLSTAIGKIREALGDLAENPRFIETVARRGYRFIAPVQKLERKPLQGSELSSAKLNPTRTDAGSQDDMGAPLDPAPSVGEISPGTNLPAHSTSEAGQGPSGRSSQTLRNRNSLLWTLVIVLALTVLALAGVSFLRREATNIAAIQLSLLLPENVTFPEGEAPVISPDGRLLAFVGTDSSGKSQLWIRQMDTSTAYPLQGTEGASQPFWSPDSCWIGFFAQGRLKKTEPSGGPPQTICDAVAGYGGTWNREGVILFSSNELYQVSAAGGEPRRLLALDQSRRELVHLWPWFLPDGQHFFYTVYSAQTETRGIYVGSLNTRVTHRLLSTPSNAIYAPPGHLLFIRDGTLFAQPFDPKSFKLMGVASVVAPKVTYDLLGDGRGSFSASETGVLSYWPGSDKHLIWLDRSGRRIGVLGAPEPDREPRLSPDERTVAVTRVNPRSGEVDIWLVDVSRGTATRFTVDSSDDTTPLWSPDGGRIIFTSLRDSTWNLYQKASSGAWKEEVLFKSGDNKFPSDWSRDGRFLIYSSVSPRGDLDLLLLPLFGGAKPVPLQQTRFTEFKGQFSPDGKWIAFVSDESGRLEVYVQHFPTFDGKRQISTGGGDTPRWRGDGKELFYLSPDKKLMAVTVKGNATLETDRPRVLFETGPARAWPWTEYAVTSDGQRFLMPMWETTSVPFTVVVNWAAELKR